MEKKYAAYIAASLLLLAVCLTGCISNAQKAPSDNLLTTYEDIDVVVTDIRNQRTWVANVYGYRMYAMSITVYSQEYELEKTFEISGGGLMGKPQQWNYQIGDSVRAQLCTQTLENTGGIVQQYINKIY